jgi:hypothetical protein
MSRLDDELRNAFKRQDPSADFTARVLAQVARQPEPRAPWWRRVAALLEPPKLRWVAVGVAASILLAIGIAQWSKLNQSSNDKQTTEQATTTDNTSPAIAGSDHSTDEVQPTTVTSKPNGTETPRKPVRRRATSTRADLAREAEMRAEGEAAKEKLMVALSIASSALNDAQKAVHDDGLKP